jgi:hypothetical protein
VFTVTYPYMRLKQCEVLLQEGWRRKLRVHQNGRLVGLRAGYALTVTENKKTEFDWTRKKL